ncbi:MAG: DUF998 domain-containing protein [Candidatus Helarchaeota archaeon]
MDWNPKNWPICFTTSLIINMLYYALLIPGMLAYPGYNPFIHAVSSIGAIYSNPNGWYFFSICLILIGIVNIFYYYGFNYWYRDAPEKERKIRIVQIFGIFDSISLIFIAIFPTDAAHPPHEFWSIMDFIFIILTILTLVIVLWDHPGFDKKIGYYGYTVIGICGSYGLLNALWMDITFLEHLSFMAALFFALLVGIQIYRNEIIK